MFYIKKITIISDSNTKSEIILKNGLNIIYGPSNTGKSLVYECVDFIFGGEARKLKKPVLKVKAVSADIDVDGKTLKLYRELESNNVSVSGDADNVEKGNYTTGKGSKKTPPLNSLWLQLIGISDPVQIYQYMNKAKQSLTIRTFIHSFLINETRMGGDNSIFKSGEGYSNNLPVATLTSLIYLATEQNYIVPGENDYEIEKIVAARKKATTQLVDLSMSELAEKELTNLPAPRDNRTAVEIQKDIDSLLGVIAAAEDNLNEALDDSQRLASEIRTIEGKIAECKMLKNRYAALRSQYESDIRRLTFIAEGEIHRDTIVEIEYCPFCSGKLSKKQSDTCVDAAIAEVDKINLQISDLRSADLALSYEMEILQGKKANLVGEREEAQATIRGELQPKVDSLRDKLQDFVSAFERAKAQELVASFSVILKEKMEEVIAASENPATQFDVRSKVKDVFKEPFERHLTDILKKCHYEHFVGARFDEEKTCDVVVNGSEKMSQGQGFRAFLNTVMEIALQETMDEYDWHKLPIMLIDSPIMSLKEKEEEKGTEITSDSMRSGLFQYMIDNCQCRQTIVLENTIPELDYSNTNKIYFSRIDGQGRYGLIIDYKE